MSGEPETAKDTVAAYRGTFTIVSDEPFDPDSFIQFGGPNAPRMTWAQWNDHVASMAARWQAEGA